MKVRPKLNDNAELLEFAGPAYRRIRAHVDNFMPLFKVLKSAGVGLELVVDAIEQGDTVQEAVQSLLAAESLKEHGLRDDIVSNAKVVLRLVRALRKQARARRADDQAQEEELLEEATDEGADPYPVDAP